MSFRDPSCSPRTSSPHENAYVPKSPDAPSLTHKDASEGALCPGSCIYPLKPNGYPSLNHFPSVHGKKMVIPSSTHWLAPDPKLLIEAGPLPPLAPGFIRVPVNDGVENGNMRPAGMSRICHQKRGDPPCSSTKG